MIITILGFSIVTFLTGLIPTWPTAGILSPISLIILRFSQGLFAGGEWANGSVITMETAPKSMRGLLSGFVQSGYSFGFVIASLAYGLALARLSRTIIYRNRMESNVLHGNYTRITCVIHKA